MGDILMGNDGKLAQDYMRAIVGTALAQTARVGAQTLVQQWGNPLTMMSMAQRDAERRMYGDDTDREAQIQGLKAKGSEFGMNARKRKRYGGFTNYHPTDIKYMKSVRYFGWNKRNYV